MTGPATVPGTAKPAIELGQVVEDKLTGLRGVATARCVYLDQPPQIRVEGKVDRDGKVPVAWENESRLNVAEGPF